MRAARRRRSGALGDACPRGEKRTTFSRVNILMLWPQTADDMVRHGARIFNPDFKIRRAEFEGQNTQSIVHLGTRQIQLCLLKSALLLGVRFSYGCELMALQAPEPAAGSAASTATSVATGTAPATAAAAPPPPWRAWVAAAGGKDHLMQGVLDFKASKTDAYVTGAGQGKCNLMQVSELDTSFALRAAADAPASVSRLPFEALLLAEGEWSDTSSKLGITKAVDKFPLALGLVINMVYDPNEPLTKRSETRRAPPSASRRRTSNSNLRSTSRARRITSWLLSRSRA